MQQHMHTWGLFISALLNWADFSSEMSNLKQQAGGTCDIQTCT